VTDAAIFVARANAAIFVVEQWTHHIPALRYAKQLLDRAGTTAIGPTMSEVRDSAGSYSYGYGN
jgi:hypothetical protein